MDLDDEQEMGEDDDEYGQEEDGDEYGGEDDEEDNLFSKSSKGGKSKNDKSKPKKSSIYADYDEFASILE